MTDTLEKAIDWMDRALRETRETLAEVDPDKREEATREAAIYLRNRFVKAGAICLFRPSDSFWRALFGWHDVDVVVITINANLTIFDMWLAAARAKAGAQ